MLFTVKTKKQLPEIERDLKDAAARHQFGVLAVHDLRETMSNKGIQLGMDCRIYEVCNPAQAKKVLDANGAVSTALPCRISVYGSAGDYTLATLLPTALMQVFGNPDLGDVATEVEAVIRDMMQAAGAISQ